METKIYLDILAQPDNTTCGPTCLHAVYRYYGDEVPLQQLVSEVTKLPEGGTLAVYLACHASRRGYRCTIYTYNLQVFDPTWFTTPKTDISAKLRSQSEFKKDLPGLGIASKAYMDFLRLGGQIRFEVLTAGLIRKFLNRSIPLLSGLSATYLYNSAREYSVGKDLIYDDVRGESTGHFVVLAGYDRVKRHVLVADPLMPNPVAPTQSYPVNIYRLICAIMLGTLTYDGDLLLIEPRVGKKWGRPHPNLQIHGS